MSARVRILRFGVSWLSQAIDSRHRVNLRGAPRSDGRPWLDRGCELEEGV